MQVGLVTYMWGAKWDLPTLLKNCAATGFLGAELRSTHAHGVEVTLSKQERAEVARMFDDSPVECVGLGSACEYHSPDPAVLKKNIELTKEFIVLAHDVGGSGVKVRPNRFVDGVDHQKTIEQIGKALRECGEFATGYGQELRLEVHGHGTNDPKVIRQILDVADHPQVKACWNSNPGEEVGGSLKTNFNLLRQHLSDVVHIHDLYDPKYPYRELFALLRDAGYEGWCLAECPATDDPVRVMHYYKALFEELTRPTQPARPSR